MKIQPCIDIPPAPPSSPVDSERVPRIPAIPFVHSIDTFEHQNALESLDPQDISNSFNIEEAKTICDNNDCIADMQEIAQHNGKPIQDGSLVYVFERAPITYSLDHAFQALGLYGTVSAKVAQASLSESGLTFKIIPAREQRLTSLDDLSQWWSREKSLSLS